MGPSVNISKTEVVCQWSSSTPRTLPVFIIDHRPLTITPSFKYLGSRLSASPPSSTAVKHGPHIAGTSSPTSTSEYWGHNHPAPSALAQTCDPDAPRPTALQSAVWPVTPRLAHGRRAKAEVHGPAEDLTEEVQDQAWGSRDCCCWRWLLAAALPRGNS